MLTVNKDFLYGPLHHHLWYSAWLAISTDSYRTLHDCTNCFLLFFSYRLLINGMLRQHQEGFIHRNNPKSVQ